MGTEALSQAPLSSPLAPDAAAPAIPVEQKGAALTRRASLTAVASLLDYTVKAAVQLVMTPILVSTLGRSLYGIWEMLGRMIGYMAATDGRPSEALRLVISQNQAGAELEKQRAIGAALMVLAAATAVRTQTPRPMGIVDLLSLPRLADPQLSPSGKDAHTSLRGHLHEPLMGPHVEVPVGIDGRGIPNEVGGIPPALDIPEHGGRADNRRDHSRRIDPADSSVATRHFPVFDVQVPLTIETDHPRVAELCLDCGSAVSR